MSKTQANMEDHKKTKVQLITLAGVLIGLIQLSIEFFGLWYWEKHGYLADMRAGESLGLHLVESRAVWWIICVVLYSRLYLKGRYMAYFLMLIQFFCFVILFSNPYTGMWLGPTWLLLMVILFHGRKRVAEPVHGDILDDL